MEVIMLSMKRGCWLVLALLALPREAAAQSAGERQPAAEANHPPDAGGSISRPSTVAHAPLAATESGTDPQSTGARVVTPEQAPRERWANGSGAFPLSGGGSRTQSYSLDMAI